MPTIAQQRSFSSIGPMIFRAALFAAGASLAAFIVYKYATQLHALTGLYAFLFPLSGVLALVGIGLAVKPEASCSCGLGMRSGVASIAAVWMVTGVLCVPHLVQMIAHTPWGGTIATFHMLAQHVFLSSAIMAFAFAPHWMTRKLGVAAPDLKAGADLPAST